MRIVGLIAEYNPFHNGHLYQLKKIKEIYPDSIIILVLNGYFLERGIISIESKETKTELALKYGVDLVIELPFIFGSNSADTFADASIKLLNHLKIDTLVFGSESNDKDLLIKVAKNQLNNQFDSKVKEYMDKGLNYPTALNKANEYEIKEPNDLLAISYIKSIIKNNYQIEITTIQRTNKFHDITSNDTIISASNIRNKLKNNIDIDKYIPEGKINTINEELYFNLLKYQIITNNHLEKILTVDEGIENRLKKIINEANNLDELINKIKTKRYTYNRLMRMFNHILIGLTKEDKNSVLNLEYIRILGFTVFGQKYLNSIKKEISIPIINKIQTSNTITSQYEIKAAMLYAQLCNCDTLKFEYSNKPKKI